MPYTASATKAMNAMKKTYGSDWKSVYYALANKRAGKGLKGAHRGHRAANTAYAKGSSWTAGGKRRGGAGKSRTTRGRSSVSVRTRGRASVTRRSRGATVRVRVH